MGCRVLLQGSLSDPGIEAGSLTSTQEFMGLQSQTRLSGHATRAELSTELGSLVFGITFYLSL